MLDPTPMDDSPPFYRDSLQWHLLPCLRVSKAIGWFRCPCCGKMRRTESRVVIVPSGVKRGDPAWSIEARAVLAMKQNNRGPYETWCMPCAQHLARYPWLRIAVTISILTPVIGVLLWLFNLLRPVRQFLDGVIIDSIARMMGYL